MDSDFGKQMYKRLKIGFLLLISIQVNAQMDFGMQQLNFNIPSCALIEVLPAAVSQLPDNFQTSENQSIEKILANWINYSAIVPLGGQHRITVSSLGSNLPVGSRILVKASEAMGNCGGKTGKASEPIELNSYPQDIIQSIGSSYTGQGSGNGHLIEYLLLSEEGQAPPSVQGLTVVYTILPAD